jgi:AraC-like DNA-binding protein
VARAAPSVEAVARTLGVTRKTLVNRLARAGMPGPSAMLAWCRLLLAAVALEDEGRSVKSIALTLDFASAGAHRSMMKRYTGQQPNEIRASGGLAVVVAAFRRCVVDRHKPKQPTA